MFVSGNWAKAFISSAEKSGCDVNDALATVKILASWIRSLPGERSGSFAALKLEKLIREGTAKSNSSSAFETALRFTLLAVKKNELRRINSITAEITKILDRQQGLVKVTLESAVPITEDSEEHIKSALEERTGAGKVSINKRINPELIGGYRLTIGDRVIDASIRSQLQKLEAQLAGLGGIEQGRNGGS